MAMGYTGADVLIDSLIDWGVDTIFGFPGDGIDGIFESMRVRQDKIRFVQVRHEEAAAFMACAYAKFTGRLGVCLATSGPGGIHLLNGLYDAKLDGQPVLAITGMQFHDLVHTHQQQDVELDKLFMDVAVYSERIMGPAHIRPALDMAIRSALYQRGVAHITIPKDFQTASVEKEERSARNVLHHTSDVLPRSARLPSVRDLAAAADILNNGKNIAILAGAGALDAGPAVERLAEKLGAPVIKALLGKAVIPDDSPYSVGGIGLLGTKPGQDAMSECDTLLIVGSSFPYISFYPKPGSVKAVQIDLDPVKIGLRYPVNVGLLGDCEHTLNALLPILKYNEDRSFLERSQAKMKDWWRVMEARGTSQSTPLKPQVVAWELGKRLPENSIVTTDSGTITTWAARQVPVKRGMMFSCSGNLATMACGLPYANAAQIAYPDRTVVSLIGDGGLTMLIGEIATAVKYHLPVKIIVFKNNVLGQIKWEQMVLEGNPQYGVELLPIDFVGVARAMGASGFRLDEAKDVPRVLDEAMAVKGPVIIEALVDPNEPPLPPHITFEQAKHFAESLIRGEPHPLAISMNALSGKIREMI